MVVLFVEAYKKSSPLGAFVCVFVFSLHVSERAGHRECIGFGLGWSVWPVQSSRSVGEGYCMYP